MVESHLRDKLTNGRMGGPFLATDHLPPLHINRFGVISKGHNTGKWRLITDLSFPHGRSVNDSIDEALSSLTYISVDNIAKIAAQECYSQRLTLRRRIGQYQSTRKTALSWRSGGRPDIRRFHVALRSGRAQLAPPTGWYPVVRPLPRRLCHHRPPQLNTMRRIISNP